MRAPATTMTTTTITVWKGSIRNSVKTTGKISPIQTSVLSFVKQWTISKIYKKVGDTVKTWDVLAEIDATSAYLDIESSKISLSNARNSYNKVLEWTTETEKIRAKNTLEESRGRLIILEKTLDNLIHEEKNGLRDKKASIDSLAQKVEIAHSDLEYAEKNIETDTTTTNLERDTENAFLILEDIERTIPDIEKNVKDILHIEDKSSPFYGDLSSKEPLYKVKAESSYTTLIANFLEYKKNLLVLRQESPRSFSGTLALIQQAKILLDNYSSLVWSTMIYEIDSSPETDYFPATLHDSYKSTLRWYATTLNSKIGNLNSSLSTLKSYGTDILQALADKNTLLQKQSTLSNAQNDLVTAQSDLEQLKKTYTSKILSAQWDIESQKNSITLNEASYRDAIDWPESTDITSAKNSIRSAEINLEKANLSLTDYQLIAPFDGVINNIPWIPWDTALSTEWILIENKDMYEIVVSLDQIDIVKVKTGMPAKIVLDAFPKDTYSGSVSRISAVPTETSGVVSYEATIVLSIPREDIFSKMSATIEIIVAEKDNIIVVSASDIQTASGKSYVRLASEGWRPSRKEVKIGITDGTKVEIISGISIGDKIIKVSSGSWWTRGSGNNWGSMSSSTRRSTFGAGWPPPWVF